MRRSKYFAHNWNNNHRSDWRVVTDYQLDANSVTLAWLYLYKNTKWSPLDWIKPNNSLRMLYSVFSSFALCVLWLLWEIWVGRLVPKDLLHNHFWRAASALMKFQVNRVLRRWKVCSVDVVIWPSSLLSPCVGSSACEVDGSRGAVWSSIYTPERCVSVFFVCLFASFTPILTK